MLGGTGALVEGEEPGSLVVSAPAARFLARGFDLTPVRVGRSLRSAFRLGGLERGGAAGGRRARFVGRGHELDLLRSRLAAAVRGQGQVVAVAGEAGIGKSRLIVELHRGLSDQPILYLEGHCLPYATPIPCLPLVEILRAACGIVETDPSDGVRDKLRGVLERSGMDAHETAPYLLHLLDPGEGGEAVARFSPEVVKARTFEALREVSRRLASRSPLVLVVEDLHWIDRTSEEFLATFVEVVAGARILLVTTHRSGYRPPWMDKSYATQVALQPLSPSESLSLVRDVIGPARVDEPTVDKIVAKAEGNPFFAEELARAVTEGGDPPPGSSSPSVPDTVEEVLMARIDRLAAEDKRVLQAAAVIGRRLPFLLLQAILDPPDEALRERLARLQGAEFLYETRAASELEYTFKHTLTHEVAYASLLPGQRRGLHARIVDALEGWQREGREELVERLAHHAIGAESWDKAVDYARRAGLLALARSAHRDAAAWFDQAVVALGHLPESRELREQAIDLRFDLRNGAPPRRGVRADLRGPTGGGGARESARRPSPSRPCLRVPDRLLPPGRRVPERDRDGTARPLHRGAPRRSSASRDHAHLPGPRALRSRRVPRGPRTSSVATSRRSAESFSANGSDCRTSRRFTPERGSWPASASWESSTEAVKAADEALAIAEPLQHPLSLISACYALGLVWQRRGHGERAIPPLERGLELSRTWHIRLWLPGLGETLGLAQLLVGDVSNALSTLQQALDLHQAMRGTAALSSRITALGYGHLLAGQVYIAGGLAQRGLRARATARRARQRGPRPLVAGRGGGS